jgi:hypothetical protein
MKELPGGHNISKVEKKSISFHEWIDRGNVVPPIGNESDEELGKYYKNLRTQYEDTQLMK